MLWWFISILSLKKGGKISGKILAKNDHIYY